MTRSARIQLRITPETKTAWEKAAKAAGLSLTEYIEVMTNPVPTWLGSLDRPAEVTTPVAANPAVSLLAVETTSAGLSSDVHNTDGLPAKGLAAEGSTPSPDDPCPRARFHRAGSYCNGCQTVPKGRLVLPSRSKK